MRPHRYSTENQRNIGIKLSKAKYISILDDDDELFENYFKNALTYLNTDNIIALTGNVVNRKRLSVLENIYRKLFLMNEYCNLTGTKKSSRFNFLNLLEKSQKTDFLWGCNYISKAEYLKKVHLNNEMKSYDDLFVSIKMSKYGNYIYAHDCRLLHQRSNLNRHIVRDCFRKIKALYIMSNKMRLIEFNWAYFIWASIGEILYVLLNQIFNNQFFKGTFKNET